jgi:hypothetical protein
VGKGALILFLVLSGGTLLATYLKKPHGGEFIKTSNRYTTSTSIRHFSIGDSIFRSGGGFSYGK